MPYVNARNLRRNLTDAERLLWQHLGFKQLGGRFRRQAPICNYIVDFACFEKRLVIELDGGQHLEHEASDGVRTAWLESQGFQVLRFWNNDVFSALDSVKQRIFDALGDDPRLNPPPLKGEETPPVRKGTAEA